MLNRNKPVWVYRNLKHGKHTRPLYSVMQDGRVVRRTHRILLTDVKFVVRENGRQRVLKEGRKNVHAFVVGKVVGSAMGIDRHAQHLPVQVFYNPYENGQFVRKERISLTGRCMTSHPVTAARAVLLNERGMTAAYLEN